MRIAPEGRPFILGAAVIGIVLVLLGWMVSAFAWGLVLIWVVAFFRDPEPKGAPAPDALIAPADGKVVSVIETDEPAFFGERAVRISIFMNVFDCHVNRSPVTGRIVKMVYTPGLRSGSGKEIRLAWERFLSGSDTAGTTPAKVREPVLASWRPRTARSSA